MRFATNYFGTAVYILLARNLQRRVTFAEAAYVALQAQRAFARMPASGPQLRNPDLYP